MTHQERLIEIMVYDERGFGERLPKMTRSKSVAVIKKAARKAMKTALAFNHSWDQTAQEVAEAALGALLAHKMQD